MQASILKGICRLFLLFSLIGCSSFPSYIEPELININDIGIRYERDMIQIDFQESYQNDEVTLIVNGKQIYSKVLTTPDNGTGFTDAVSIKRMAEQMELKLIVNGKEWISRVNPDNGNFIGISYLDGRPRIEQAKNPFYYD